MTMRLPCRRAKAASARASATGSRFAVASSRMTIRAGDMYTRVRATSCFAGRELDPAGADQGVQPTEPLDEGGEADLVGGPDDRPITDPGREIGEVVPQRAGEHVRLLRNQAQQPPQLGRPDV